MPSWKSLTGVPSFIPDTMLLMTDATVLVHDSGGQNWYRLTPDGNGRYDTAGANWSGPFPMQNSRQFFASGVLANGQVYVVGGEYFNGSATPNDTPLGEIFDPQTNTWSPLDKPAAFDFVQGDANSCILQDGRVLFGSLNTNQSAIWDPVLDTWTEAGRANGTVPPTKVGASDEETWTLLPDGTVLTVTIASPPFAEKYIPATDTWVPANPLSVPLALLNLPDTTVNPPVSINIGEIGPAILLPDGRLFFVGATGHTALYTPPAIPSDPGTWAAGHDLPPDTSGGNFNSPNGNIQTAIDAPAVLLPGGKVLLAGGNTVREVAGGGQVEFWSHPATVFIYDPPTNNLTQLGPQPPSNNVDCWQARFLLLPTGQVLMTTEQSQRIVMLIDPAIIGTPDPAWKPVITGFTSVMAVGHHYKFSGRQINGLSQANSYGDDAQMATNYPIAKFTRGAAVSYFRTFDFSTMAVATGGVNSALVEIPASATPGSYTLQVVANGIQSDPVNVQIVPAAPAIAVNLQDDLLFGTVCDEPQFLTLQVFNVGGADLIVDSVARISGSPSFSVLPNPVTPLTVAPGDEVDFTVRFAPAVRGVPESAVIRIGSNDPVQPNFDVSTSGMLGTGNLEVIVTDSGSFGNVCVGGFVDKVVTLNNNGPCQLTIFDITSSSAEFEPPTVLTYPLIIRAGVSIDVPIRLQPSSVGSKSATLTITSDDPASPKIIHVSGIAPAPKLVVLVADSGNFGHVCLRSFADLSVTLNNSGLCPLIVSGITSSSPEFIVPGVAVFPFTVAPGTAIAIPIRFQPDHHGASAATITVFSNDPSGPHTLAVSGHTPSGRLAVSGSTYFGEVDCGIAQKTVSICNVGDCKLFVSHVDFSRKRRNFKLINNPFPAPLHPGSCLGVVIQYRADCEPEPCELVIRCDDPDEPHKVLDVVAFTRCEKKCECKVKPCCCGDRRERRRDDDC